MHHEIRMMLDLQSISHTFEIGRVVNVNYAKSNYSRNRALCLVAVIQYLQVKLNFGRINIIFGCLIFE